MLEAHGLRQVHPAGLGARRIAERPQQAVFCKADAANSAEAVVQAPLEAIPGTREGEGQLLL